MAKRQSTWIVVADAGRARIYTHEGAGALQPVADGSFENPHAHEPTRALGTDKPGRSFESAGGARHAEEPRIDWHRQAETAFAKKLAEHLEHSAAAKRFDRVVVSAPPPMLGDLRTMFGPQTRQRLAGELRKDLTKIPVAELAGHFRDLL
jgi:protein required for attachment to host cells